MAKPPFSVGISGHINLHPDDLPVLREAVRSVLQSITEEHPDRPLRILSSLAEGADRLVTHEALAFDSALTAVLPMNRNEYENDFASPESRREFRTLLEQAEVVMHANLGADPDLPSRYTASDLYLAADSDLILALWDGQPTGKGAGTAWVLGQRLDDPAASTAGPVVHLLTRRADQPPLESPGKIRWLLPGWQEVPASKALQPS